MKITIMSALLAATLALSVQASPAQVSDRWLIADIAKGTDLSPCIVRQVLGDHFGIVAQQYNGSPASRGRIKRTVRQRYDMWLATQAADSAMRLQIDRTLPPSNWCSGGQRTPSAGFPSP